MAWIHETIFSLLKGTCGTLPLVICQMATLHLPAELVRNPLGTKLLNVSSF